MFSLPVKSGWKPAPSSSKAEREPLTAILPSVGWIIPEINFKIVVFPEPFGPIIPNVSPLFTLKEISSKARKFSNVDLFPRIIVSFKLGITSW